MIDFETEEIIPVTDVPKHWTMYSHGRRPHRNTVARWCLRGIRVEGHPEPVRLETRKLAGVKVTSLEALARFVAAQNETSITQAKLSPGQRQRQAQAAMAKVQELVGA